MTLPLKIDHEAPNTFSINSSQQAEEYEALGGFYYEFSKGNITDAAQYFDKAKGLGHEFGDSGALSFLLETGQYKKVIDAGQKIIDAAEGDQLWETHMRMATAYEGLHQKSDAQESLLKAQKAATTPEQREKTVYQRAIGCVKGRQFSQGISIIDDFLANESERPKHALFYLLKASMLYEQGPDHFEEALKVIDMALNLSPTFDRALQLKIMLLEFLKRSDDALDSMEKLVDIKQDEAMRKRLIEALFARGQFEKAYCQLVCIAKDTRDYAFDLALTAWKAGMIEKALKHIERSLEHDAEFPKAKFLRLEILAAAGKTEKAQSLWKSWLSQSDLSDQEIIPLMTFGKKNFSSKDLSAILARVAAHRDVVSQGGATQSDEAKKETMPLLLRTALADALNSQGEYAKALKHYRQIKKQTKKLGAQFEVQVIYNMAYACYNLDKKSRAQKLVRYILKLDSENPDLQNVAAMNLQALLWAESVNPDDLQHAYVMIKKAHKKDPLSAQILDTYATVLEKMGFAKRALKRLEKAMTIDGLDLSIRMHYEKLKGETVLEVVG